MLARPAVAGRDSKAVGNPPQGGRAPRAGSRQPHGLRPSSVPVVESTLRTPGVPLDGAVRASMEESFGRDFGHVRVHRDELAQRSASALHADAYTAGEHVVFARDRYRPERSSGRRLIAHELAHIVQQDGHVSSGGSTAGMLEQEAGRASADLELGRRVSVGGSARWGMIQRQEATADEPTVSAPPASTAVATPATTAAAPPTQSAAPPAPAVPAAVQAVQADAAEGRRRLGLTVQELLRSGDPTERNTGGLFTGANPRIAYTTMTLRSDSDQIRVALSRPAATSAFYFYGPTQQPWAGGPTIPAGTVEFGPTTLGTIDLAPVPPQVVIRVKYGGAWRDQSDLKQTFVHESSHILQASYNELPQTTTNAASFDRYRDEFRAYWVADFSNVPANQRWKQIRRQLVGDHAAPPVNGYPDLQNRYWGTNAAGTGSDPAFRAQVDGYHQPVGFNLTNSPRLDALFRALDAAATDPTKIDAAVLAILQLPAAERGEARSAGVITGLEARLPDGPAQRVRDALSAPTNPAYGSGIAAVSTPRVTAFLTACALNEEAGIKAAYGALSGAERSSIAMDAAVDVFLDHHLPNVKQRASVYAMVVSMSIGQYDAMNDFLLACLDTLNSSIETTPAGTPPHLMALLRRLSLNSRLSLYVLNKGASAVFVDPLPAPVLTPMIPLLRGDRDQ